MAKFSHLAPELLTHILKLSTEGEPAQERQRFRLAFGLISRACFLITAGATEFCVEGAAQAKAFAAQLEKEKMWSAQEERKARSGRTSRSALTSVTRVSNIRRLTLIVIEFEEQKVHADLLRATPNLIALEFVVGVNYTIAISSRLAMALGGLLGLRELQMRANFLDCGSFLKCLTSLRAGLIGTSLTTLLLRFLNPLKALEVLDLGIQSHTHFVDVTQHLSAQSLPNLRQLRINLHELPGPLLRALVANSTHGIQVLHLKSTALYRLSSQFIEPLLSHLSKVVYLTWDAPLYFDRLKDDAQDAVLALIGSMTSLKSISMPTWITETDWMRNVPVERQPINHTLFDTLAALPSLQSVKLIVKEGSINSDHVVSYLGSHQSLRYLSIHFSQGTWTREERDAIEEASDRAGVAFS